MQDTNQMAAQDEQDSLTGITRCHHIESIDEFISRGGRIRTLKSHPKTTSRKSHGPVLLTSLHHRFPSPESLAIAKEIAKLRAQERRV